MTTAKPVFNKARHKPHWKIRLASLSRWVHIYISMVSCVMILFFAVTGLTLNHQDRFNGERKTTAFHGKVDLKWVKTADARDVAKLEIVEYLRRNYGIRAELADFHVDDTQCELSFKAPGYEADAFIDRETGSFQMTENRFGLVAILNDLHKGRDLGKNLSVVLDVSAILLICVSLTGLTLIFFLPKRRRSGLVVLGTGAALFYLAYVLFLR